MKIKMLASFAGEWSCRAGDEVERPDEEATRLIDAGFARPVRSADVENTSKTVATETTAAPRSRKAIA